MTKHWWPSAKCLLSYDVASAAKKILHLYDYQNDSMPLVILVIKYIKGDDDLEKKEAQDTS